MQKKQTILVVASLLVVVLSVTLAYFTAQIIGKGKDISVTSNNLQILFDHSDGNITGTDILPGWSTTKKFTITNKSNATYKYDIVIQNLVNTFVTEGYLQYKITSNNGGFSITDYVNVPKSETAADTILGSASINVGVTQTYTIEFIYKNDENVDQSIDMGKILKGTIFITEGSASTLAEKLLEDNPTISERTDFSTPFTTNTANTLYKAQEDNADVYYFAGTEQIEAHCEYDGKVIENIQGEIDEATCTSGFEACKVDGILGYIEVDSCEEDYSGTTIAVGTGVWFEKASNPINNWVKFGKNSSGADLYWRIIRTNSDGSIRLLYHGTNTTATDAYIGGSAFNSTYKDSMYVGYMYGTSGSLANNRTNENSSTIKSYIDTWYQNNLASYTKYLSTTAIYCNDREVGSGTYSATGSTFDYAVYTRLSVLDGVPTYNCTNENDKFTVDSSAGNGKLTYPIALMTLDEIIFAGGAYAASAPMWYYTNSSLESSTGENWWWLLSPGRCSKSIAQIFFMYSTFGPGAWYYSSSEAINYVRPVISLKSDVVWKSGDGSSSNPYEIEMN